jgi:hypothetical protein
MRIAGLSKTERPKPPRLLGVFGRVESNPGQVLDVSLADDILGKAVWERVPNGNLLDLLGLLKRYFKRAGRPTCNPSHLSRSELALPLYLNAVAIGPRLFLSRLSIPVGTPATAIRAANSKTKMGTPRLRRATTRWIQLSHQR